MREMLGYGGEGEHKGQLESRVLAFIRRHHLVARNVKLVVAISGGPDSVCLLHLLCGLENELGIQLHVAHLDHKLRGADSSADAQYVAALARKLDLPATVEARDVKSYRARRRTSLEEAAREVRYAFLADVVGITGAAGVVVGHTRDDNIETVLMHLVRGAGTKGLRGLQPLNRLRSEGREMSIIRPLLDITREETVEYCREHGLAPRSDESNLSLSMFRNRIRLDLLPFLRRYNPAIDAALLRMARIASDELGFLQEEASRRWNGVAEKKGGTVVLKKAAILCEPAALKRELLRMAIEESLGNLMDIESRHIDQMLEAMGKPAGKRLSLPGGLFFAVEYDRYLLTRDPADLCPFPPLDKEFRLNIPGETVASGWRVTAAILPVEEQRNVSSFLKRGPEGTSPSSSIKLFASVDFERVGGDLVVRSYRPGDRFQPLGLGKSKKVGEFMLDARIPRPWRSRVPLVASPEEIVWVAGWRIDERARVSENTKKILRMELGRA